MALFFFFFFVPLDLFFATVGRTSLCVVFHPPFFASLGSDQASFLAVPTMIVYFLFSSLFAFLVLFFFACVRSAPLGGIFFAISLLLASRSIFFAFPLPYCLSLRGC